MTFLTRSISRFMLGFFNIQTLSREGVIYALTRWAPLHQPPRHSSSNPHHRSCAKKMPVLPFPKALCSQAHSLLLEPPAAGCLEENQRAGNKAGGKVRASPQSERAWPWLPMQGRELTAGTQPCSSWRGTRAFDKRVTQAVILALCLGELIWLKHFLAANANWCLRQVLRQV